MIYQLSQNGGVATVKSLVEQSGASEKTVRRDLLLLKKVGYPLTESTNERGQKQWRLAGPVNMPVLNFTLEEAAALYLGRQFLEPLAGTFFFNGANSAFAKIRACFGDAVLRHLEKLAVGFYSKTHGLSDYSTKGELIDDLVRAIEDRRLTVITYQSLRSTEPVTHYDIHPYGLAWHKHALYLIAWSCDHQAIRTFKVDRISSAATAALQFQRPRDFDLAEYLAGSFGIFQGDGETQTVHIRFSSTVARVLHERVFHPSQHVQQEPSGSLLVTYQLSTFEELLSWLLSFGQHAEVLEPQELREKVVKMLEESLEVYRNSNVKSVKTIRQSQRKNRTTKPR
jgi:proteasome accessory factor B